MKPRSHSAENPPRSTPPQPTDLSYTVPLNPRNGTLRLAYGSTRSRVIEEPFDFLDIKARSRYYELTYRQPLVQRPTDELAVGLGFSRQESQNAQLFIWADISAALLSVL